MEEKEPFKIKFTTVLIVVLTLLAIIGILAFNLRRLEDQVKLSSAYRPEQLERMVAGVPEVNDFEYFSENYKKAINTLLGIDADSKSDSSIVFLSKVPEKYELVGINSVDLDNLGDVYLNINQSSPLYATYGKTTKVASDVIDFEICEIGNGGFGSLFFIHSDGTVSKLSGYTTDADGTLRGKLETEKLVSLNNILKITRFNLIESSAESVPDVAFIDINGNMFYADGTAVE